MAAYWSWLVMPLRRWTSKVILIGLYNIRTVQQLWNFICARVRNTFRDVSHVIYLLSCKINSPNQTPLLTWISYSVLLSHITTVYKQKLVVIVQNRCWVIGENVRIEFPWSPKSGYRRITVCVVVVVWVKSKRKTYSTDFVKNWSHQIVNSSE